ncbi:Stp1/IreP family PP2C-type Ser/Thr phosphatase [Bacillus sp. FSL W7-1360]
MIEGTAFLTDVGQVRTHNEDNGGIFTTDAGVLAVVADGMGGHAAGDVASRLMIETLDEAWQQIEAPLPAAEVEAWLTAQFSAANQTILDYAKAHPDCEGMGTTAIAAVCTNDYITIAHVGDSRAYVYRTEGLMQQTNDHSLVAELVRSGQISVEEADHHPRRHVILRALGTDTDVDVDCFTLTTDGVLLLLLCSDGLSNKVTQLELQEALERARTSHLSDIAAALIARANERGGEDNISLALVRYEERENTGDSS